MELAFEMYEHVVATFAVLLAVSFVFAKLQLNFRPELAVHSRSSRRKSKFDQFESRNLFFFEGRS